MKWSIGARFAALLLVAPSVAAAGTGGGACLNPDEVQGLVQLALPDVVGQISDSCSTQLPATAYLIRARADLVARYEHSASGSASVARGALGKITGLSDKQSAALNDDAMRGILKLGVAEAVAGKIKPGECTLIDEVLEQLAPLPPENMARLIGIALREGGNKKDAGPFKLCPATAGS